nr:DUF373 family protein [Palaeococcus ferrophilus]
MKIRALVLAIDRDDDFGRKAGVKGPVVGRDACIDAALKLSLADPEDSDANVLYAAIKLRDQLKESGDFEDVEVALITGHEDVGVKSDVELLKQLNAVLHEFEADGVIPVTDGAEDEQVFPIITSRIPIISTHRVVVKQSESIETTYYIIYRYLREILGDPEVAKVVLGIPGLIAIMYGVARLISIQYPQSVGIISSAVGGTILLVIGAYFFNKGFNLSPMLKGAWAGVKDAFSKRLVSVVSTVIGIFVILSGALQVHFNLAYYIRNSSTISLPGVPTNPLLQLVLYVYFLNPMLVTGLGVIILGRMLQAYIRKDYHIWHHVTELLLLPAIWGSVDITTTYILNLASPALIEFYRKLLIVIGDIVFASLVGMYMREKVRGWGKIETRKGTPRA